MYLILTFGGNIELRVKLSYVFSIVPYGIYMNIIFEWPLKTGFTVH